METCIARVVKLPVAIFGCGRTDACVHASQYFFHIDLEPLDVEELKFRVNKHLPADIAVFDIIPVHGRPNARLDAIQRTYDYFIHRYKDPFLHGVSSFYQEPELDLEKMKAATMLLSQYNNYRGFYRTTSKPKTTICKVSYANLVVDDSGERLKFTISANRFLMGMVRIIVKRLIEVGGNNLSVDEFESYLMTTATPKDVRSAFPQGLYLSKVTYPFLDMKPRTRFDQLVNRENTWREI
ncbi:tRNA pseudouridine synthase A [Pseudochryseolinea flava]|nr:tRNA pseudouridine synthase A [Pseudochryseolinea flava]